MEGLNQYLLTLIAAALICSMVTGILGKKGALAAVGKLLSGVFLTLTVISPLVNMRWSMLTDYFDTLSIDAESIVAWGRGFADSEAQQIIKAQTEAYILDKATSLEADIAVVVTLSPEEPYAPISAEISGSISPYGRMQLSHCIAEELGIPKEAQVWIG